MPLLHNRYITLLSCFCFKPEQLVLHIKKRLVHANCLIQRRQVLDFGSRLQCIMHIFQHSCSCIFDTGLVIENGRIHCTSSALEKGLYLHLQWKRVLRKTFVFVLFFYTGSRKNVSLQVHTVTAYLSRSFLIITHPLLICCIHDDWNTYRGSIQETATIKQSDVECSKMRDVCCYWRHI